MKASELRVKVEESLKNDNIFRPGRGTKDNGIFHLFRELTADKLATIYLCHDAVKMLGYNSRVTVSPKKNLVRLWVGKPQFKGNTLPKKKKRHI